MTCGYPLMEHDGGCSLLPVCAGAEYGEIEKNPEMKIILDRRAGSVGHQRLDGAKGCRATDFQHLASCGVAAFELDCATR